MPKESRSSSQRLVKPSDPRGPSVAKVAKVTKNGEVGKVSTAADGERPAKGARRRPGATAGPEAPSAAEPAKSKGGPAFGPTGDSARRRPLPAGYSPSAARQTRELKDLCLGLPGVTRDIKWGNDLCYSVGGKMFAAFDVADTPHVAFKADDIKFERLTKKPGIIPAPYAARFGWVKVVEEGALSRKELERLLRRARELVMEKLPAKKRAAIEAAANSGPPGARRARIKSLGATPPNRASAAP
jgi:predicted DNA-binding protein (MmcQ/YjbR family)